MQEWILEAWSGRRIQLIFENLDVEPDSLICPNNGCCDYVQVSYGSFSQKYCGTTIPEPITSTGNTIMIKFHSDWLTTGSGFKLKWTEV